MKQTYQSSLRFMIPRVLHHTVASDSHGVVSFLVSRSRFSLEISSTREPKTKVKISLHHTPLCWSWCLYILFLWRKTNLIQRCWSFHRLDHLASAGLHLHVVLTTLQIQYPTARCNIWFLQVIADCCLSFNVFTHLCQRGR